MPLTFHKVGIREPPNKFLDNLNSFKFIRPLKKTKKKDDNVEMESVTWIKRHSLNTTSVTENMSPPPTMPS